MAKQVKLPDSVDLYLNELVLFRNKSVHHTKWTKQALVGDLIIKAHKRECRK